MHASMWQLASSLVALQLDLESQARPFCVLVHTEFGRTIDENSSSGTDHGHGGVAILMASAGVLDGPPRVHAPSWSGLPAVGDLPVATDIRDVMTEILQQFLGNTDPNAMHSQGSSGNYTYTRQKLLV